MKSSKLKTFAGEILNVTLNTRFVWHRVENIVGKEENAGYQHFLLSPHCFQEKKNIVFMDVKQSSLRGEGLNNGLVSWLFSFSQIKFKMHPVICLERNRYFFTHRCTVNYRQHKEHSDTCLLTLSQTMDFRLFQTERVCRRQFHIWWKWHKGIQMGRKHCGKRRNCSLRAISSFPPVFSKDMYCSHVKTRACLGKS